MDALRFDFRSVALLSLLILPFPRGQRSLHEHKTPLAQVLAAMFGGLLEHNDAVPFGLLNPVPFPIRVAFVGSDIEAADRRAVLGIFEFGVAPEASDDFNTIEAGRCVLR